MKNKMSDLYNALFVELETLQDVDSFTDDNGKIDQTKAELAIKKADAISNIAGKLMEVQRLQLDAVRLAIKNGIEVRMPETLGIEVRDGKP